MRAYFFLGSTVLLLLCGKSLIPDVVLWDTMVLKIFTREMADKDGPIIADAFYEELFRGPDVKPLAL